MERDTPITIPAKAFIIFLCHDGAPFDYKSLHNMKGKSKYFQSRKKIWLQLYCTQWKTLW